MNVDKLNVRYETGVMAVERYKDNDHPGFTLYVNGIQVGVLEYDPADKLVKLHAWDGKQEEPVFTLPIRVA